MKNRFAVCLALALSAVLAEAVPVLTPNAEGKVVTGKFKVLDRDGELAGVKLRAEQKFIDGAASATMEMNENDVRVVFTCPVPKGMTAKATACAWDGDHVELFFRPSLETSEYFQYCLNVDGVFYAAKYSSAGAGISGWKTRAKTDVKETEEGFVMTFDLPRDEIFPKMPSDGESFGVNFCRGGETCGGVSVWSDVGKSFANIDMFGKVLWGDLKKYAARRLDAVRQALPQKFPEPDKRQEAEDLVSAASPEILAEKSLDGLESRLAELDRRLLGVVAAGVTVLAYEPKDVWGKTIAPSSDVRPIRSLKVVAARNSRTVAGFAVANMLDKPFLGQIKVFDGKRGNSQFFNARKNVISRKFAVSRGFPRETSAGDPLFDPVEPLPMGSVLRLAPREHAPIWLELDTHGVPAGTYECSVELKSDTKGFSGWLIPLRVEVVSIDPEAVPFVKAGYEYINSNWGKPQPKLAKLLVDRGYNMLGTNAPRRYPVLGDDGCFEPMEFDFFDYAIDDFLAGGVDRNLLKLWISMGLEVSWLQPRDKGGNDIPFGSPKWEEAVTYLVTGLVSHIEAKYGIGKERIIWYPVDEPRGSVDDPTYKSKMSRAYAGAKLLKRIDPAFRTMTDPDPTFVMSKEFDDAVPRLRECYDILELYRRSVNDHVRELMRQYDFQEIWTYSIEGVETPPVKYRRDLWENMRDGFREIAPFWNMTDLSGDDAFDPNDSHRPGRYTDYASLYADFDNDTALLSRRQIAYDQGCEDARLVMCLRQRFKDDAPRIERINALVREAADAGTMAAMDAARENLLKQFGNAQ